MSSFDAAAVLVVLAAVLGYFNYRFVKLPQTIGLTVMGDVTRIGGTRRWVCCRVV